MAWIQYFRITGGELAGNALTGDGSFDNVTWNVAPDPDSNVFKYCQGDSTRLWDGVSCKGIFQQMNVGDEKILWLVNVKQDSFYDEQIYLQISCISKDAYVSSFNFKLMKRVWTDDSHFTDTNITNVNVGSVAFYFGSPYVITEIINTTGFVSTYNNTKYTYFGFSWLTTQVSTGTAERHVLGYAIPYSKINNLLDGEIPEETGSPEFGPASEPGGGYIPGGGGTPIDPSDTKIPTFDNTSDKITVDGQPTESALGSDLVHAYKVTDSELDLVAEAMYPDYVISATDIKDALIGIWNSIFFSKYVDFMLDLLILPIDVPAPNAVYMKAGGRFLVAANSTEPGSKISTHLVTDQYVDVTCGSISVDEYWVNFLDFAGTKVKLFLPYVGYVDIQPEYVIGGTLYVDYRFNVIDGSFMAYVRSDSGYSELEESLIGQYAGVAAMHVPLQSADYSNKVSGLISAIGSVAAGAASGGIAAAGAGAAASAANTIIQKPGSSHANGYNASSSFLSHRTPYLIIERQWAQFSEKYPEEVGMPSNVACRIGDLSGLVKSSNAHLDTIPANSEIKERISRLLADGIIV